MTLHTIITGRNSSISPWAFCEAHGTARALDPPPELARAVFYSSIPLDSPRDDSRKPSVDAGIGHPNNNPGACSTALHEALPHGVDKPQSLKPHGGSPVPIVTAADLMELGAIVVIGLGVFALMAVLYL